MLKFIKWLKSLFSWRTKKKQREHKQVNITSYSRSLPSKWTAKKWAKLKRKKKTAYQSRKFNSMKRRGKI
jgi:hypothetical protein